MLSLMWQHVDLPKKRVSVSISKLKADRALDVPAHHGSIQSGGPEQTE
jgi:hypothetical protein